MIPVRVILALAVFGASLGVVPSGRLPATGDLRISASGGQEPSLTAIVQPPVRWSPAPHKKRPLPPPSGGHPALVGVLAVTQPGDGWTVAVEVPHAPRADRPSRRPASPRAPPRLPAS